MSSNKTEINYQMIQCENNIPAFYIRTENEKKKLNKKIVIDEKCNVIDSSWGTEAYESSKPYDKFKKILDRNPKQCIRYG